LLWRAEASLQNAMGPFASELVSRIRADRLEIAIGAGVFVASFLGSVIGAAVVLCRLPVDHLRRDLGSADLDRPRWLRVLRAIARNALGVFLVLLGVVLSLPGVPGQGLLTILIGVILLDLPGKQRFERRLMTRPAVFTAVNVIRARFGREPLLPPLHAG
jgi:hypothetical protein